MLPYLLESKLFESSIGEDRAQRATGSEVDPYAQQQDLLLILHRRALLNTDGARPWKGAPSSRPEAVERPQVEPR
jgi:hypothetical protein